ncbi:MAG: universal stress protein [Burkholderiaceae bacterium]|nr:MAG: universal stress protein [Burkholderiaceae bacterium]
MSCKTILVNLDIDGPVEPAIEAARDLAARLQATLIGLCAADARWPIVAADGGTLAVEVWQRERDEIKADFRKIHATFDRLTVGFGNTEWREVLDSPTRALAGVARVADLVVMRAASGAATGDSARAAAPSSVILQAGRPVLVMARGGKQILLNKVVITWKDTREARRALADAVPLLAVAGEVIVVTAAAVIEPWIRRGIADATAFLARHGIRARAETIKGSDESARLLEFIAASGADLVVSGAYGHSRLRQWVFGGVTRSLLDKTDINRFLSS